MSENSTVMAASKIEELLGDSAAHLLEHECNTISKDRIHAPGPDFIDRCWKDSNRNPQVLRNLSAIYNHGRLAGTGYVSILPVTFTVTDCFATILISI